MGVYTEKPFVHIHTRTIDNGWALTRRWAITRENTVNEAHGNCHSHVSRFSYHRKEAWLCTQNALTSFHLAEFTFRSQASFRTVPTMSLPPLIRSWGSSLSKLMQQAACCALSFGQGSSGLRWSLVQCCRSTREIL